MGSIESFDTFGVMFSLIGISCKIIFEDQHNFGYEIISVCDGDKQIIIMK